MIATDDYRMLQIGNIKTGADLFYYLWLILFFPIVSIILFSAPYYLLFRIKCRVDLVIAVVGILFFEYLFYVYFNSQKLIDIYGIFIALISLFIFYLLFYKRINLFFHNNKATH